MSTKTKRLQTIPETELRRVRGGEEAEEPRTSKTRPLTGFYNDAVSN